MKWLVWSLMLLGIVCLSQQPRAYWQTRDSAYNSPVSAAAGFSGAGDVVSGAFAWWGFRAYSAAYAAPGTNVAANIRRASDSHACDLLITAAGGIGNTVNCGTGGDNAQTATSFCNATTCFVTKMYDQSGATNCGGSACNVSQATAGHQPTFNVSGQNGRPTMSFAQASSTELDSTNTVTQAQPFTFSCVVENIPSGGAGTHTYASLEAGGNVINNFTNSNTAQMFAGSTVGNVAATDSAWHAIQDVFSGASSNQSIDGTSSGTVNAGAGAPSSAEFALGTDGFAQLFNGNMGECGFWASAFNGTQQANMNTNQHDASNGWNF